METHQIERTLNALQRTPHIERTYIAHFSPKNSARSNPGFYARSLVNIWPAGVITLGRKCIYPEKNPTQKQKRAHLLYS